MKKCSGCHIDKNESEFNLHKTRKDGLQTYCRSCDNARKKVYYYANKHRFLGYNTSRRTRLRNWLNKYKADLKCSKCEESNLICLDFHHIDPSTKKFNIAEMTSKGSLENILKEINKCIILCANCHRKLHSKN